jgi:L-aminopeptidase/D-esterase-like protein
VLYFPKKVVAAVDVRGGAPGTVNTDALRLAYDDPSVDAIVLSGGSSYGLSAATGVANALKDVITDPGNFQNVALVAGAIIFDLSDRRFNIVTPDEELGRAALTAARAGWFPLGARGAGRFAMQGYGLDITQHSGQGAAFRQSGNTKVLVVTVINGGLVIVPVKTIRTNVTPSSQALDSMVGHYVFAANAIAELRRKGPALDIEMTGPSNNYFTPVTPALLTAVATDEFEVAGPREDRLHIDRDEHGIIVGVTLNPGLWAIHATRSR